MAQKEAEQDPFESIDTLFQAVSNGLSEAQAKLLRQEGAADILAQIKQKGGSIVYTAKDEPKDDANDDLAK